MDAFWREHKRFVGIAAVFLLVAGMGSCVLIAPAFRGAARIAAERRQAAEILEKRLKEEGSPSAGDIEKAENDLALLKEHVAGLGRAIDLHPGPPFELPAGERDPRLYVQHTLVRTQKDLAAQAADRGVKMPKTGLGFPGDFPAELSEEYLARLGIVHRILTLALATVDRAKGRAGIQEITSILPRAEAGLGERDAAAVPDLFLNKYRVEFRMTGTSEGVLRLLQGLLQADRFLGIERLEIAHENPTDPKVDCVLTATGYRIHPEGSLTSKTEASEGWMESR